MGRAYFLFNLIIFHSVILTIKYSHCLIPTACVSNATRPNSGICCPFDPATGLQCGGPERGKCLPLRVHNYPVAEIIEIDDRIHWPLRFIRYTCHCKSEFFGVACEECAYGRTGDDCQERRNLIRRDIRSYSAEEKERLVDLLVRSNTYPSGYMILEEKDNTKSDPVKDPIWIPASVRYYVTFIHNYSSRSTLYSNETICSKYGIVDFNHDGLGFMTWHRYFMMIWERLIGRIARDIYGQRDFSFPFWDWIGRNSCEVCTNDLMGAPGEKEDWGVRLDKDSPFYNWEEYCAVIGNGSKCVGCHSEEDIKPPLTRSWKNFGFPTKTELEYALNLTDYFRLDERDLSNNNSANQCKSFHRALEGFCSAPDAVGNHQFLHNRIHNLAKGTFCCSDTAVNDPLFALHHSQVDRFLQAWISQHDATSDFLPETSFEFGQCRDCTMVGFIPAVRHRDVFVDSVTLGYTYEHMDFGEEYLSTKNAEHRRLFM